MSAADTGWEFDVAVDPEQEDVEPPTRDDLQLDDPEYRAEMFVYEKTGAVELRCANGYLNTEDYVDLDEWQ